MKKIIIVFILVLGAFLSVSNAQIRVTPVANITLAGGQYFLDEEKSSFGGNSSIYYSPVVNFSETNALVPVFNIDYSGTRNVQDLVGGGTLTRQTADVGATIKYVRVFEDLKVKTRVGWKRSLINETEDEKWNRGLFDYDRLLFGVGVQKPVFGHGLSLSADYYTVSFPNYSSLIYEEEYETSIDTETYTEISNNAGEDVLDYQNTAITLEVSKNYTDKFNAFYSYRLDTRPYKDQTIVQNDGSFSAEKRKDTINTLALGVAYRVSRVKVGLENEVHMNRSNQNSYDANATKFNKDFYSYNSVEFSPLLTFYLGSGERLSRLGFWWSIEFKRYNERLAQDVSASYTSDKVRQTDNGFGLSYSYPLFKTFL
ncbi:hypothetical protein ACFLUV_03910 [Elusimicrobiota bacterium]